MVKVNQIQKKIDKLEEIIAGEIGSSTLDLIHELVELNLLLRKQTMEYIIVDDLNQWLATCSTKKEANETFALLKELRTNGNGYGDADEIGETLYLYEAKEIKRSELNPF